MGGWVTVMEPADYEGWLSGGRAEGSLASTGEKLFQDLACVSCHRSDIQGRGPALKGLFKPLLRHRVVLSANGLFLLILGVLPQSLMAFCAAAVPALK